MNAAEAIAAAASRAMETELDAKRRCQAEIEATMPETPAEYRLKDQTLDGLGKAIAKLEAHVQVNRILLQAIQATNRKGMDQ